MPRATRKALAEDAPSRSSPRASTRASTAAASSPTKSQGRRGKGEDPESPAEVETKSRGRSSSRAKAVALPKTPAGRQSRSRGRSAGKAEAKSTPKKGLGKPKKQQEEEEEEEEEVEEEDKEEIEEAEEKEEEKEDKEAEEDEDDEEAKTKRGRSTGRKTKAAAEKSTPPARSGRGSRRSAEATPNTEEEEEEGEKVEPKKTGGRQSRGKATPTATPPSRSRRSHGAAGEPGKEEASEQKAERDGKAENGSSEAEQEEGDGDSEMKEKPAISTDKAETEKEAELDTVKDDVVKPAESKAASTEAENKMEMAEEKTASADADSNMETEVAAEEPAGDADKADAPSTVKPVEETEAVEEADKKAEEEEPAAHEKTHQEAENQRKTEEAAPTVAEEAMEEEPPAGPEPETKNGDTDSTVSHKPAVKRKREEDHDKIVEEILDDSHPKRVRINGIDTDSTTTGEAPALGVDMSEPKPSAKENEESTMLKDFEVVNKDDLPPPDSLEVAAAVPALVEEGHSADADKVEEKMEEGGSGEPVTTVAPLTEAEMARVYGGQLQAMERNEDASSTIVEVGSVAGSDVTGGLTRGLDISELQSGPNSIDGDDNADVTLNESSTALETTGDVISSASEIANPLAAPSIPDKVTVTNGSGADPVVDQAPACADLCENSVSSHQAGSSVQNSHPTPPQAKGSGSVTDVLGTPDPAFLAAYSSPGILSRVFVPNSALPGHSMSSSNTFSVVSYNILAECHRRRSKYKCPSEFLDQEYRHELLMKELLYLNGDVICLQEVDPDYYNSTLLPAMKAQGYEGLMKRRTKDFYHEGEATFYKSSVFDLVCSKAVSLTEAAHKEVETGNLSSDVAAAINKYLDRADIVLITQLRCKAAGKVVTVGNIHVVWDLKSPDVQCIQAACAVKEVVAMSGSDGAHVVCGDFNAEWNSPLYQLVLDGYLTDSSIQTLQNVQLLELDDGANKSLVNHLWRAFQHTSSNMKSSYSTVTKSEPEVTQYSSEVKTVDYTFYSASCLVPQGVLKTVDLPVVSITGGLPTKDFPSDHLALKTVFTFCK